MARETRKIGNVGGELRRQTKRADFLGKPQPAKMLHGPGLGGIGLRVECGGRLLVHQQRPYLAPPQLIGQHQPARAAANDENRNTALLHAGSSLPDFAEIGRQAVYSVKSVTLPERVSKPLP